MSDQVVDDQIAYYRQRAREYDQTAYGSLRPARERIERVVSTLPQGVPTLELACGTGMWTAALARRTNELTALDSAPEALAIAKHRCPARVQFRCADVLRAPAAVGTGVAARYDLIFFAFWLSHVPSARLAGFFDLMRHSLTPSGRIVFVDPEQLSGRLAELGWRCDIVRDGTD